MFREVEMIKKCMIENCDKPIFGRQMCKNHYEMKRIYGRTHRIKDSLPPGTSVQERLLKYSKLNPKTGCIEWLGKISARHGYGHITVNKKSVRVHRISWEIHNNKSAANNFILHTCDNRKCINPEHLKLGSHEQNMQDMTLRSRQAKGSSHGMSKLNESKIIDICKLLNDGMSQRKIAKIYKVCQATVNNIKCNRNWKHVEVME